MPQTSLDVRDVASTSCRENLIYVTYNLKNVRIQSTKQDAWSLVSSQACQLLKSMACIPPPAQSASYVATNFQVPGTQPKLVIRMSEMLITWSIRLFIRVMNQMFAISMVLSSAWMGKLYVLHET